MRTFLLLVLALLIATPAFAGDLTVSVRDSEGRPVRDAVVTVHPATPTNRPVRFPWPMQVTQKDVQFHPYVLIVPKGALVTFANFDPVQHHVYSFSRGNRFEIKLFGRGQSRNYRFTTVGVAAIGCNIHDQMMAYVKVVDTPWAAKTTTAGDAVLTGVPAGEATLRVWHPALQGRGNEAARAISVKAGSGRQVVSADFSRRAPPKETSPPPRYP